jgi:hypothetical protein
LTDEQIHILVVEAMQKLKIKFQTRNLPFKIGQTTNRQNRKSHYKNIKYFKMGDFNTLYLNENLSELNYVDLRKFENELIKMAKADEELSNC